MPKDYEFKCSYVLIPPLAAVFALLGLGVRKYRRRRSRRGQTP